MYVTLATRLLLRGNSLSSAGGSVRGICVGLSLLKDVGVKMTFQPIVFSGPSGSGKSTLVKRLMDEFKDCFAFSVSHTTRKPRPGEEAGVHYNYVTREELLQAVADGEFIEHAEFSGNIYGTSKQAVKKVIDTGRICILDIDMQGVRSVKKTDLHCRYISVQPPSLKHLEERLRGRGTETEESVQKRLDIARAEVHFADEKGMFDHVIVNDDLDVAYEKLKGILIRDIDSHMKSNHHAH